MAQNRIKNKNSPARKKWQTTGEFLKKESGEARR